MRRGEKGSERMNNVVLSLLILFVSDEVSRRLAEDLLAKEATYFSRPSITREGTLFLLFFALFLLFLPLFLLAY